MWRAGRWAGSALGKPQLLHKLEGRAQMAAVNRVEGATEDADGLQSLTSPARA